MLEAQNLQRGSIFDKSIFFKAVMVVLVGTADDIQEQLSAHYIYAERRIFDTLILLNNIRHFTDTLTLKMKLKVAGRAAAAGIYRGYIGAAFDMKIKHALKINACNYIGICKYNIFLFKPLNIR